MKPDPVRGSEPSRTHSPPLAADQGRSGYFDHDADVGVVGRGATLEGAFVSAAEAMFALMVNAAEIEPATTIEVSFTEPDPEFALVSWLNALLAQSRTERLALGRFELARTGDRWTGRASGEAWRPDLDRGVEVKGATLTELSVEPTSNGWTARCVVDV